MKCKQLLAGLSVGLACLTLTGCSNFSGTKKAPEVSQTAGPVEKNEIKYLLRNKTLADLNKKVSRNLVSARYTAPYYRYSLDFPGLLRVDNQGFLTCGHIRGDLHQVTLGTIIGPVQIMHPQEGQRYGFAPDRLNENEEVLSDELTENERETETSVADEHASAAESFAVTFSAQAYQTGERLLKDFYVKSGLPRQFLGTENHFDLKGPVMDQKEKIGDYEWYHLSYELTAKQTGPAVGDETGEPAEIETATSAATPNKKNLSTTDTIHFYGAVINGIRFIISYRTENLEDFYQSFEYLPLKAASREIQEKGPQLLQEMVASLTFYRDPDAVLKRFDAGNFVIDPRGGASLSEVFDQATGGGLDDAPPKYRTKRAEGGRDLNFTDSLHYNDARIPGPSFGCYMLKTRQLSSRVTRENEGLPEADLLPELKKLLKLRQANCEAEDEEVDPDEPACKHWLVAEDPVRLYLDKEEPEAMVSCNWDHPLLGPMQAAIYRIPAFIFPADSPDPETEGRATSDRVEAYLLGFRSDQLIGYILNLGSGNVADPSSADWSVDVRLNGLLTAAASLIRPMDGEVIGTWELKDLVRAEQENLP